MYESKSVAVGDCNDNSESVPPPVKTFKQTTLICQAASSNKVNGSTSRQVGKFGHSLRNNVHCYCVHSLTHTYIDHILLYIL